MKSQENGAKDQEISRKRKFSGREEEDKHLLTLSLSFIVENHQTPPPVPPPLPQPPPRPRALRFQPAPRLVSNSQQQQQEGPSKAVRARRNPTQSPREGKGDTVPVPFPWATNRRATVNSLDYLLSNQIFFVKGDVQCKKCERQYEIEYDLQERFVKVWNFIAENKSAMHDRAPSVWMNPVLPSCKLCNQENAVKPIISEKKKSINWLFLLLGQMLGCCTLEQLKYFCKHTQNHRTGAKDRVLYLAYLGLCKQLDPNGPFDR